MKIVARKVEADNDLKALFGELGLEDDCFIIKPNWFCPHKGYFTDVQTLDLFLRNLDGSKIIIESHTLGRNVSSEKMPENAEQNREWIRQLEEQFLNSTGLVKLLERDDVEYINITEEVWAGRTVGPEEIAGIVEEKYPPITHKELYGYVPRKLFELRGRTLINLAKMKVTLPPAPLFFSLGMKNLFGLIPDPSRGYYHGSADSGLSRSITDINEVYHALFPVCGFTEAIYSTRFFNSAATDGTIDIGKGKVIENLGVIVAGKHPVALDACTIKLLGFDYNERHFIEMGSEIFGQVDEKAFDTPEEISDILRDAVRECQSLDHGQF